MPKRRANIEDAINVSVTEWLNLPPSLFIHAWVSTGYLEKPEMQELLGKTDAEIEEAGQIHTHIHTYIYIYIYIYLEREGPYYQRIGCLYIYNLYIYI